MSWEQFDTDRFLDESVIDKAGHCLQAMVKQCAQKKLAKPGYMEFINQFQKSLIGPAKKDFILEDGKYVDAVEAGFIDFSKLQSGDFVNPEYAFVQNLVGEAISKMKIYYEQDFKRKPYLQEVMAAFSTVAVGNPASYFSDGGRMPLLYIKAIQRPF